MHFKSLRHIRDHAKVVGTARQLLQEIGLHVNYHTGEAFDLTVERLAHHLHVTPQWVGQLKAQLVATGELLVKQSRGRHPNVYIIPWERCPACQGDNPKLERGDDLNPKVPWPQPQSEPQSGTAPTPKYDPANPKVEGATEPQPARIEPLKEVKDLKNIKEGRTPNSMDNSPDKPEMLHPCWCPAHGFCHGERLPDHRPDCWLERPQDPEGVRPIGVRLAPHATAGLSPIAQVLDQTLTPEGTP